MVIILIMMVIFEFIDTILQNMLFACIIIQPYILLGPVSASQCAAFTPPPPLSLSVSVCLSVCLSAGHSPLLSFHCHSHFLTLFFLCHFLLFPHYPDPILSDCLSHSFNINFRDFPYSNMTVAFVFAQLMSLINCQCMMCRECVIEHFEIIAKDKSIMKGKCPTCDQPDLDDLAVAADYFAFLDILVSIFLKY